MNRRWCREERDGPTLALIFTVHAQPGARKSEVAGLHGDALKVRIAAPPVAGKANAELVRYFAELFAVPLRRVTLLRGASARNKTVRVEAPVRRPDHEWIPP